MRLSLPSPYQGHFSPVSRVGRTVDICYDQEGSYILYVIRCPSLLQGLFMAVGEVNLFRQLFANCKPIYLLQVTKRHHKYI